MARSTGIMPSRSVGLAARFGERPDTPHVLDGLVLISTARGGLDALTSAGGLARRTLQGRSAAEGGSRPAILFRDAKTTLGAGEK